MSRYGLGEGRHGVAGSLLGSCSREARNYGECDQSRMDGRQRPKYFANTSPGVNPQLACARLDPDGTPGNPGRHWKCNIAFLLGKGRLDYRTSHLRGRWIVIDESRGASGNTAGITPVERGRSLLTANCL